MDDQGREPTRDEINMAWMQAMEQVREMKSATEKESCQTQI